VEGFACGQHGLNFMYYVMVARSAIKLIIIRKAFTLRLPVRSKLNTFLLRFNIDE